MKTLTEAPKNYNGIYSFEITYSDIMLYLELKGENFQVYSNYAFVSESGLYIVDSIKEITLNIHQKNDLVFSYRYDENMDMLFFNGRYNYNDGKLIKTRRMNEYYKERVRKYLAKKFKQA